MVKLSSEQIAILDMALPPTSPPSNGTIVRINAAAGTGKTTTLIELARKCASIGHIQITYVTFSKAAARDAEQRIQNAFGQSENQKAYVVANTLHSCAMRLLKIDDDTPTDNKLLSDDDIRELISAQCGKEIETFLKRAYDECEIKCRERKWNDSDSRRDTLKRMKQQCHDQVVTFIFKTFEMFCRSSFTEENLANKNYVRRHYYPAKLFHQSSGNGKLMNFPHNYYSRELDFYADQAYFIWNYIKDKKNRSYNIEMKHAQLAKLKIPGSVILVDESQDMDQCQVSWVSEQIKQGTHVYFVGDAAQSIYSFRGARPQYVTNLKAKDMKLTTSWRFGPEIANMANLVLYSKEKSPQTTSSSKTWNPYRLYGGGEKGIVTTMPLSWKEGKMTIIGYSNAALLMKAVQLLGMEHLLCDGEYAETGNDNDSGIEKTLLCPLSGINNLDLPRIHVNGQGKSSGISRWKAVFNHLEHLFDLFISEKGKLPVKMFKEWHGDQITWDTFKQDVENQELLKYKGSILVVEKFKQNTMEVIKLFKEEVMNKNYSSDEADVVLSTCHSAKGMEWDRVEVIINSENMAQFKVFDKGPEAKEDNAKQDDEKYTSPMKLFKIGREKRQMWQFNFKSFGDEINIIYVAFTRAKKVLSIPSTSLLLLKKMDLIHEFKQGCKNKEEDDNSNKSDGQSETVPQLINGKKLTKKDVEDIHIDICMPLREELQMTHNEKLVDVLIPSPSTDKETRQFQHKKLHEKNSSQSLAVITTSSSLCEPKTVTPENKKRKRIDNLMKKASKGTNPISNYFAKKTKM